MLRFKPFAALRPRPELAAQVAAVPYDVVDAREARAQAEGNPLSFLHVTRSEIDLPAETDPYDAAVYRGARAALERMVAEGTLQRESAPCLYAYMQEATLAGRAVRQVGLVGCCHIDDYNRGVIKKHEVTRKDKEDDRTRHTLAISAHAGPVFLTYKPRPALDALTERAMAAAPLYDFRAADGVRHVVWRIEDCVPVVDAFASVDAAYVADGHHRSASAARAGAELRAGDPGHRGDEDYNWFLCVLFAADQLNVLPYHRVVKDLRGLSPAEFRQRVAAIADVTESDQPVPERPGSFGMYLDGRWYRVTLPPQPGDRSDPVSSLDYVRLSAEVLGPLLGIEDLRTDKRIDFVGGIRGSAELERRVDDGRSAVAFAMAPVTVEQLMQVADAGLIMPPKSTWFEPKLRSGLLVHTF